MGLQASRDLKKFSGLMKKLFDGNSSPLSNKAERYIATQSINLALTSLTLDQRIHLYKLLDANDFDFAKTYIESNIPDFQNRLIAKINAASPSTLQ
jgi:hypothetical protein